MNIITERAEMLVDLMQFHFDEETITLTTIEQTTRLILQEVGRQTVEMTLKMMNTHHPEPDSSCDCGSRAAYVRQRETCLHTLFGKLRTKRAYYLCSTCRKGTYPLDEPLGLRPNALSTDLIRG